MSRRTRRWQRCSSDDQRALAAFRAAGVTINTRCLRALGCVVGATDATVADELRTNNKLRADQRAAFRRLPLLRRQTGMLALRHLTGTVLTNRLRAMTPASTAAHAAAYDKCVLRAAHQLVGIAPLHGDSFDFQLQWPLRIGGFGLTSAVEIAPAAYIAGRACTLPVSPAFAAVWSDDGELDPSWPLHSAVVDSHHPRRQHRSPTYCAVSSCAAHQRVQVGAARQCRHVCSSPQIPVSFLPASSQAVTHRIHTLSHIARVTQTGQRGKSGEAELARLQLTQHRESQGVVAVAACAAYQRLPATVRQPMAVGCPAAAGHLLHQSMNLTSGASTPVHTQRPPTLMAGILSHASVDEGIDITARHNAVLQRLAHSARMICLRPIVEPAGLHSDDNRRPDIQLDLP